MPIDASLSTAPAQAGRDSRRARAQRRRLVLRNEFAIVALEICGEPGRERLCIKDLRTESAIELDALELESLAWASHTDLGRLLDPGLTRWVGAG